MMLFSDHDCSQVYHKVSESSADEEVDPFVKSLATWMEHILRKRYSPFLI